jgi:hypothetical protein
MPRLRSRSPGPPPSGWAVASTRLPFQGSGESPRLSDAEAIEQAAGRVERFYRILTRSLRSLQEWRRRVPAVVVQNAGPVNVAEQQVNVARRKGGKAAKGDGGPTRPTARGSLNGRNGVCHT